jgi:putative membrane protein
MQSLSVLTRPNRLRSRLRRRRRRQIRDHEKTIALFEREAKSGKDAELKAFAEKTLPTLKEHLSMVRDLKTKLAKGGTN